MPDCRVVMIVTAYLGIILIQEAQHAYVISVRDLNEYQR